MKSLFFILILFANFFAHATPEYPIKNYRYISDLDFRDEVEIQDKYLVIVFSSQQCLERINIERNCWLFEKKLDYFVPRFSSKVKVVGFNTYFDNYQVTSNFRITKTPTVVIYHNGQLLEKLEANYQSGDLENGPWQDQLLNAVLDRISNIR